VAAGLSDDERARLHGASAPVDLSGLEEIKKPPRRKPARNKNARRAANGAAAPRLPFGVLDQLEILEEWITGALGRGELDAGQAAIMRMLMAQITPLKPDRRAAVFKELARIRGLYSQKMSVAERKPPSDLSTLELIQVVGSMLGMKDWKGVTPAQLPDPTPKDYAAATVSGRDLVSGHGPRDL